MSSFNSLSFFLLLSLFLSPLLSNDWQAMGNFTPSNVSYIYTTINDCITRKATSSLSISSFPLTISDALNSVWDKAWNVFVTELSDYQTDSIVYGYAFRDHWFWLNNYGSDHLCYVIWKDYNCGQWVTFNHNGFGSFNYTFPV